MGFSSKALVFFLVTIMAAASSMAATYDVGDGAGWTTMGNIDYDKWASSKTFHAGDTLRFVYNREYHNVLQVTSSDYKSCTTTAPLATYWTGNEAIQIMGDDHLYFICGIPGHCDMGQKVEIQVAAQAPASATPPPRSTPSATTPPPSTPSATPPPPSKSSASYLVSSSLLVGLVGAATYLIFMH